MGREKEYRQRLKYMVDSAKKKTLDNQIAAILSSELGMSETESRLLSARMSRYLFSQPGARGPNQILVEAHCAYGRKKTGLKKVELTPFAVEDLELELEFGLSKMQQSCILRLAEEAYLQGALLSAKMLSLICNITPTSLRMRLGKLRQKGILAPVAGASREDRAGVLRSTWALAKHIEGVPLVMIRREVAMSRERLLEVLRRFAFKASKGDFDLDDPEEAEWSKLWCNARTLPWEDYPEGGRLGTWEEFRAELVSDFGFSPIKVRAVKGILEEIAGAISEDRPDGDAIYWAVSSDEPAGKPIEECRLIPSRITFFSADDVPKGDPNRLSELKLKKALRYAVQAKSSGGYLTYADLSYLLGIHTEAIRGIIQKNPDVAVPLRGAERDMGRGVTHRRKIIELYLQMYTETEIAARTGHSYEAIENYIRELATVKALSEKGMPAPLIRRVTGRSMKLVNTYLELLREYSGPEYAFRLHHLSKVFIAHQGKKGGGVL